MGRKRGFTFPGVISTLAILVILAALGVPRLVTSRSTPKTAAVANLRLILTQEFVYAATHPEGAFATLNELRIAGLLDKSFATGRKDGYRFDIVPHDRTGFSVTATPVSTEAGVQLVLLGDETGIIRVTTAGAERR